MLTGGSGLLGLELKKAAPAVVAPGRDELDIRSGPAVSAFIAECRPDIIIHAAAETDNRAIEADPGDALDVNIGGTLNIARACVGTRIRLVYLSTDYVYPGDRGNYAESDSLLPRNLYAWTKLAGEAAVRAVANHLIIRTSFGASEFPYPAAFTDKWSSKDYVDLVAPQILEAATSPLTGVLNVGGPRRTLYEFAALRNPGIGGVELGSRVLETPVDSSLDLERWTSYRNGEDVLRAADACRICGNRDLVSYLDLGMLPLANNLAATAVEARHMRRFPMQVLFCSQCALSQLSVVVDPRELFSHYTYRSSVSKGYVDHCRAMARDVGKSLRLNPGDLVADIAGNDGALLAEFRDELGVDVLNVDPATNIAAIAEERGIPTINAFWSAAVADDLSDRFGKPRLITATNVFAHVDDVRGFVEAARRCLADDGALLLEFPYGVDFIEHREFDTIYFEHLSYLLIKPLATLAANAGLELFDVSRQDIHGGTVRVFLAPPGVYEVQSSVARFLDEEAGGGFHSADRYLAWRQEIDALIADLREKLTGLAADGARVAAFAASAKGNTLLNACRLDTGTVAYIVDDTPEKIGRFSPGNGIPIVDRSVLAADPPDYLLILAWNFTREIVDNTPEFSGRYIVPIPEFRLI